jgi:hypothetical protein
MLAVAALGTALFAAAACGGDDGGPDAAGDGTGTGNGNVSENTDGGDPATEEVCAAGEQLVGEFQTELQSAAQAVVTAAAAGDQAALEEASAQFNEVTSQVGDELRGLAAGVADPELRGALEAYATALEALGPQLAENPSALAELDTTAMDEASATLDEFCGTGG